ncbi:hypothetical protein ACLQ18_16045 [Streptomyces sp. DT193]|uniref:hypothetical protein n=1 Tax=Streptomyces sp. DT193 TaxID=3393418 RepID=UPI003CF104DD
MTQTACGGRTPSAGPPASYDAAVRSDSPALYLPLGAGNTVKRSTAGLEAAYHHAPGVTSMPNGDQARVFDGTSQYVEVPDDDRLSVTATGAMSADLTRSAAGT